MSKAKDIELLRKFQEKLIDAHEAFWHVLPCDLIQPLTKKQIEQELLKYASNALQLAKDYKSDIRATHLNKYASLLQNKEVRSRRADVLILRRLKGEECSQAKVEYVARLADEYGFDGSIFRNLIPPRDPLSLQEAKRLKKQIETIPKIIAAIEKPADNSFIPDGTELLSVAQVAHKLGWGESVVRQRDKQGLLPLPSRINGTIQWSNKELDSWIVQKCPSREQWKLIKQRKAG